MHNIRSIFTKKNTNHRESIIRNRCPLQYPAAITACLIRLGFGTIIYWPSPSIPHLTSSNSKFTITTDEASWVVSLSSIGNIIGFLLYPVFVNRIGRKYTMLLFAIPQVFSWLIIYYASNVHHLYIARILAGMGYSAAYVVDIIYVGEIAKKNIRGFLIILGKISFCLGSLIVVALGAFVSYDNMNLILFLISLIFIVTFSFMPESPYFYIKINRDEDALKSLAKLRGARDTNSLKQEIETMKEGVGENVSKTYFLKKLFGNRSNLKAFLISTLSFLAFSFSGSTAIASHTQIVVGHFESPLKPEQASVLIMIVALVSSIVISPIPDWLGRRILTLWYGIIVGLSSFIIAGLFFYKFHFNGDLSSIYWISFVLFFIYVVFSGGGLFCLSHILVAELFSLQIKSSATCLIHILWSIIEFCVQLNFEQLMIVFKIYGLFFIYSIMTLVITFSNYLIMPETKGKTLEEIQNLLAKT
ncbi:facilitated trehalose transporter Tret1-like [Leptopilina heterotoma]|uniref:facilitated trehalose transporter Tret1-like n=1 Tax=Leptopilina heterotoma TaxID=63436 RepID=UPI001CA81E50|nr:facilitated trehalose transporter Tret1-like [Leptopilina heterotoma]